MVLRALDAEGHGLGRHRLAETPLAIKHGKRPAIGDEIGGLALEHETQFQPFHVARHANHAVAVMAGEVRTHEVGRDASGFGGIAAGRDKDVAHQGREGGGGDQLHVHLGSPGVEEEVRGSELPPIPLLFLAFGN